MKAVSFFSNCGAGDVGYAAAGFQFEVIAEIIEKRLQVASLNHPDATAVPGDLRQTYTIAVDAFREKHGLESPILLSGCPPCQGMSSASSGRGQEADPDVGTRDGRNLLVLPLAHATSELKPVFVVVENVPAFLRKKVRDPSTNDPVSAARLLCRRLEHNYEVYALLVNLSEFGVPQRRNRAFLTFVRKNTVALETLKRTGKAPFPAPTHGGPGLLEEVTVDHALRKLGLCSLDAKSITLSHAENQPMHQVPLMANNHYEMVATIPPGSGASAWETNECSKCGPVDVDSEAAICPDCEKPLMRPVRRKADGSWRLINGFRNSSYRRMAPDQPAATITTASGHFSSDRTIHPWENRVLSPAECAFLQTFPSDFKWGNAINIWGHRTVRKMIGEAVPPLFTELHGRVLASLYKGMELPPTMDDNDPHCTIARKKLDA